MRLRFVALAVAAAVAGPAAAQDSYEVVRLGDGQMACEALVSDMNTIRTEIREIERRTREGAEARQTAGRMGRGLLSGPKKTRPAYSAQPSVQDGGRACVAASLRSTVA